MLPFVPVVGHGVSKMSAAYSARLEVDKSGSISGSGSR